MIIIEDSNVQAIYKIVEHHMLNEIKVTKETVEELTKFLTKKHQETKVIDKLFAENLQFSNEVKIFLE